MSTSDTTVDVRAQVVLLLRRLNDLGGFEAAPEDRGILLDSLLQDVTEPAPDDGPER